VTKTGTIGKKLGTRIKISKQKTNVEVK